MAIKKSYFLPDQKTQTHLARVTGQYRCRWIIVLTELKSYRLFQVCLTVKFHLSEITVNNKLLLKVLKLSKRNLILFNKD